MSGSYSPSDDSKTPVCNLDDFGSSRRGGLESISFDSIGGGGRCEKLLLSVGGWGNSVVELFFFFFFVRRVVGANIQPHT